MFLQQNGVTVANLLNTLQNISLISNSSCGGLALFGLANDGERPNSNFSVKIMSGTWLGCHN